MFRGSETSLPTGWLSLFSGESVVLAQREDEFEPALVAVADRDCAAVECDGVADIGRRSRA